LFILPNTITIQLFGTPFNHPTTLTPKCFCFFLQHSFTIYSFHHSAYLVCNHNSHFYPCKLKLHLHTPRGNTFKIINFSIPQAEKIVLWIYLPQVSDFWNLLALIICFYNIIRTFVFCVFFICLSNKKSFIHFCRVIIFKSICQHYYYLEVYLGLNKTNCLSTWQLQGTWT